MANNYKHSGRHIPVASASGAITVGNLVYQEGVVGVALNSAASGASLDIATEGVWEIAVPSGTVKGDLLYADLSAESVSLTLTEAASGAYFVGQALTARDTDGNAQVKLMGGGAVNFSAPIAGSVAVAADALAIPVTHRYVAKTAGSDAEALTLADGSPGQMLTVSLVATGGGAGTLTPTTLSGFTNVVLADAGDTVTLQFVDGTVGWVIIGAAGVTAPPVIAIT